MDSVEDSETSSSYKTIAMSNIFLKHIKKPPSLQQNRTTKTDNMKQKMVIRIFMDSQQVSLPRKLFYTERKKMSDRKLKAKILKTVVSVPGVDKAEFKNSGDKSLVEVEGGDGFNPIDLIEQLRKSVCRAEIDSVAQVK